MCKYDPSIIDEQVGALLPILQERVQYLILDKKEMRCLAGEFYNNRRILAWHNAAAELPLLSWRPMWGERTSWDQLCGLIARGEYELYIRHLLYHLRNFFPDCAHSEALSLLSLAFRPPGPKRVLF